MTTKRPFTGGGTDGELEAPPKRARNARDEYSNIDAPSATQEYEAWLDWELKAFVEETGEVDDEPSIKQETSEYYPPAVDHSATTKTQPLIKHEPGVKLEHPPIQLETATHDPSKAEWILTTAEVPASAKKIYAVLRGHKPGFYYDWFASDGAEAQVRGFQNNLFMSFPQGKKASLQKSANKVEVVKEAVNYMNHDDKSCKYGCGGKCRRQTMPADVRHAGFRVADNFDPDKCRGCRQRVPAKHARGCADCKAKIATSCEVRFSLNDEQARVLQQVADGRNVFFTGAAGTGKSRVIESIVAYLKRCGICSQVVAPTGMAALNVYGTTLHMFAGWTIKIGESKLEDLKRIAYEKKVWRRIGCTVVLIIDEISMVESDTLTRLSYMVSAAKRCRSPFGGIQVVVTGDFFQLPPVLPFKTCLGCGIVLREIMDGLGTKMCPDHGHFFDEDKWAFRSEVWSLCAFENILLTQVHRQKDPVFTRLLHNVRQGEWTDEQEDLLLHHPHEVEFSEAVKLCPTRREVGLINDYHMSQLSSPTQKYHHIDDLTWAREHREFLTPEGTMSRAPLTTLKNHKYCEDLELKVGMKVILLQNLSLGGGLVNGTTGTIVGLVKANEELLPRAQKNEKDTSRLGEPLITHPHCHYAEGQIRAFWKKNQAEFWPVVRFDNDNHSKLTMYPHCSITELGEDEPYSYLSRTQIPLLAGWAITIHKSQGMTLSNVAVSLDRAFAPGMAYVALSRAKSLKNMIVQSLPSRDKLLPDKTVLEFTKQTFG